MFSFKYAYVVSTKCCTLYTVKQWIGWSMHKSICMRTLDQELVDMLEHVRGVHPLAFIPHECWILCKGWALPLGIGSELGKPCTEC